MKSLPYFCRGEVVRGFGRGSKELGIPTANFPDSVVEHLPADISTGIYYGWACVGSGDVYKMVMSIGWNPYYKNTKKSMETHVIHTFKEDFYGEVLSVVLVGYIRPERSFDSLDALISAINGDIEEAKVKLDQPEHLKLKTDNFFSSAPHSPSAATTAGNSSIINGQLTTTLLLLLLTSTAAVALLSDVSMATSTHLQLTVLFMFSDLFFQEMIREYK